MAKLLALIMFLGAYTLMITEKINRTIVAVLAATLMMILGIFENHIEAYKNYIDFNTIFLLLGMMIFVTVIKRKGIFEYMGIITLRIFSKNGFVLFFGLTFAVAVISAIIDNVTTILVFVPVTLAITDALNVEVTPFIIGEILASNIGGTATIIGDPPNMMISTAADISFVHFFEIMGPISFLNLFIMQAFIMYIFRKDLNFKIPMEKIKSFDPKRAITDKRGFAISWFLLILTLTLFIFQHKLELESSTVALFVGFLSILLLEKHEVEDILKNVEWESILFFIGLFIVTGGLEETGVLRDLSQFLVNIAGKSIHLFGTILLFFAGIVSGFVDNIPFTATMIPVIENLPTIKPEVFSNIQPLWYSLALGACLGGNATPIGASANIIGLAMLKRFKRKEFSFFEFMKWGLTIVLLNIIASAIYLDLIF